MAINEITVCETCIRNQNSSTFCAPHRASTMRFKPLNLDYHAEAANVHDSLDSRTKSRPSLMICFGRYEKSSPKGLFRPKDITKTGTPRRQNPPSIDHEAMSHTESPMEEFDLMEVVETSTIATESRSSGKRVDIGLLAKILRRIESECKTKLLCDEPWSELTRSRNWYGENSYLWGRCSHLFRSLLPVRLQIHPIQSEKDAYLRYSAPSIQSIAMIADNNDHCRSNAPTEASGESVEKRSSRPPTFGCLDPPIDNDSAEHVELVHYSVETESQLCLALVPYVAPDQQIRHNEQPNAQQTQSRPIPATDAHQGQKLCSHSPRDDPTISIPNESNSPTCQVKFAEDVEVGGKQPVSSDLAFNAELKTDDVVKRDATHISGEDEQRAARKKAKRDKKKRKRERGKLDALSHLGPSDPKLGSLSRRVKHPCSLSTTSRQTNDSRVKKQQSLAEHAATGSPELRETTTNPTPYKSRHSYLDPTLETTSNRLTAPTVASIKKKGKFRRSALFDANSLPLIAGAVCARKNTKQERGQQPRAGNSSTRRPSLFDDDASTGGDPNTALAAKRWFEQASKRKTKKNHSTKKRAQVPSQGSTRKRAQVPNQDDVFLDAPEGCTVHPLEATAKPVKMDQARAQNNSRSKANIKKQTADPEQNICLLDDSVVDEAPACSTIARDCVAQSRVTETERKKRSKNQQDAILQGAQRHTPAQSSLARGSSSQTKSQFFRRDQMCVSNPKTPAKQLFKAHKGVNMSYVPRNPNSSQPPPAGRVTRKSRESGVNSIFANSQTRVSTNESKLKASSSTTPSYYMTLVSNEQNVCAKPQSGQRLQGNSGLSMVPRVHPTPQPTGQESGEKIAQRIDVDSKIPRSNEFVRHHGFRDCTEGPEDTVQGVQNACVTELQLLCTEPFLDFWGDVVAELGRFPDRDCLGSHGKQRIVLLDTPLMNFSGVDVELPGRCGLLLFDASTSLNTTEQAKEAVLDIARLAAIGRYVQVFVFVCVQGHFSAETAKHLIQLQCAAVPARGLPETVFSFQTLLRKRLPQAIATTVRSQESHSTSSVPRSDLLRAVSESTTRERAIFLQALVPVLSPTGALEVLHMAKNMLPSGCPFFQVLFKNQRVLKKIALLASSTERSTSIHPHAIRQLIRVTHVTVAPTRSPNDPLAGHHG